MNDALELDDKTMRFIEQRVSAMKAIESELNGALSLLIEQHELSGRWQLDLPNRRLVRSEQQLKAA
jgi:hypothetical protein